MVRLSRYGMRFCTSLNRLVVPISDLRLCYWGKAMSCCCELAALIVNDLLFMAPTVALLEKM